MLRNKFLTLFSILALVSSYAQEPTVKKTTRRGEAAGYSSRDATVLSVMGWGAALAIGIATLSALLSDSEGNNGHSH